MIIRFHQFDGQPSDKKVVNTLKSKGYIFAYHKFGDISMIKKATLAPPVVINLAISSIH